MVWMLGLGLCRGKGTRDQLNKSGSRSRMSHSVFLCLKSQILLQSRLVRHLRANSPQNQVNLTEGLATSCATPAGWVCW